MPSSRSKPDQLPQPLSAIGQLVGSVPPLLPGEPAEVYARGLQATIEELGAHTPLQVYLAEQIFDCLWWVRRYEQQKRSLVIETAASMLFGGRPRRMAPALDEAEVRDALAANDWNHAQVRAALRNRAHTPESILQEAMGERQGAIAALDQQIGLRLKTMQGLQASYEVLVTRKLHAERLKLQNDLLRRDLQAIDVQEVARDDGPQGPGQ